MPNIQSAPVFLKNPRCHFASCACHSCHRARGHLRVDRPRAVGRADDARFTAGAGARVSRAPRVDERDARAAAPQLQRRPAAERAGADHDDRGGLAGLRDTFDAAAVAIIGSRTDSFQNSRRLAMSDDTGESRLAGSGFDSSEWVREFGVRFEVRGSGRLRETVTRTPNLTRTPTAEPRTAENQS